MNEIITFIKKNWKVINIGILVLFFIGSSIFTGILNINSNRRLQQTQNYIREFGEKVSATNSLIGELKVDNSGIAEIAGRIETRVTTLDDIYRAVEAGNRRQEEIYRGITAGVSKIQNGLGGIESNIGKLSKDFGQFGDSFSGSLDLINEGLSILNGLPK